MRNTLKLSLCGYMSRRFLNTRKANHLTQDKFSEYLMMSVHSYSALERGISLCSMITFVIYLVFFCKDPDALIRDLREIVLGSLRKLGFSPDPHPAYSRTPTVRSPTETSEPAENHVS